MLILHLLGIENGFAIVYLLFIQFASCNDETYLMPVTAIPFINTF